MPTQPLGTPREGKVARRKVTTDLGRQIMQRERQRLAREQAALGEQLAAEAKRQMAQKITNKKRVQPEQIAVNKGIARRIAAVLQSEGVNAILRTQPAAEMSAWTDFDQIVVHYRQHEDVRLLAATMRGLCYHEGGHCRFTIPFRQLVELALGSYISRDHDQYHKAWNCLEDQRMETAVVSDSPRKAAYLTPVILTEMADTVNGAAANWPLFIWRKYLPSKVRKGARKLFVAKHMLMGLDGEALAKRWERAVTQYVMADNAPDMWAAVVEAHELLKLTQVVPAANDDSHDQQHRQRKDDLDDALVIPIDPSMLPDDGGVTIDMDDDEAVIDTTDPAVAEHLANIFVALFNHPETLLRIVYSVPTVSNESSEGAGSPSPTPEGDDGEDDSEGDETEDDGESQPGSNGSTDDESDDTEADEDGEEATDAHGDEDDTDDDDEQDDADGGRSDLDADSDDDDDDESDDDDDYTADDASDDESDDGDDANHYEADDAEEMTPGGNKGQHNPDETATEDDDDEELTDDDLQSAIDEAEAERDEDDALDADVRAFQDAVDTRVSDLLPYQTQPSTDYEAQATAHNLADELERSFHAATMENAPMWVEQQRRGVLNVMRYKTRQPGDTEFFKSYIEDDAPGYDMAVSILLDYSGSMGGHTTALAQCGYAAKLACEKLDIPCTVVLWDTDAMVLWDAQEQADALPVINAAGGTDPQVALADLRNQRYDKAQHVVVIMTDGEWNGHQNQPGFLAAYKEDGRIIIGAGYNSGYGTAEHIADKLRRYGCDESYALKDLMDLPRLLEQTLVACV